MKKLLCVAVVCLAATYAQAQTRTITENRKPKSSQTNWE